MAVANYTNQNQNNQIPLMNNNGNYQNGMFNNSQNGMMMGNGGYQMPVNNGMYNANTFSNNYSYDGYVRNLQPQQNNNQFLKCRPVSSKEEARAFQIDLDGSLWVFTDVGNGKIYTKQINNDGTATFNTYEYIKEEPQVMTNSNQFVTREELNKVVQNIMAAFPQLKENVAASPATSLPSTFE